MLLSSDAPWILLMALLLDALIGGEGRLRRYLPRPYAWLEALAALGQRHLDRAGWSPERRRDAGIAWMAVLLAAAVAGGCLLERGLRALPLFDLWIALVASTLIAQRGLYERMARVRDAASLEEARAAASAIVGRDASRLDEAGIVRAAIGATAARFARGVVAPAFWFALAGLPGMVVYALVDAAASTSGRPASGGFGWAAARLDDLLTFVPAHLAALLIAVAAPAAKGSPGQAIAIARRDAPLSRSPDAGWPTAAMAGALGLALGGPRPDASDPREAPFVNAEGRRDAVAADLGRALKLLSTALLIHVAMWTGLAVAV